MYPYAMKSKLIVVTGAAGFIGSAVVWKLNAMGITDIIVVDRIGVEDDKWRNLAPLKYRDYVHADAFLEQARRGDWDKHVGAMIHLGANSSTTETDAKYLKQNNTDYTRRMAEFCLKNGTRFIYASSAATYGDGRFGYSDRHAGLAKLKPLNLYGWSKQKFDLWALKRGLLNRIVGLKYFNVFGPNEYHKGDMRSVVVKAYEQIRDTGAVRLFKSHRPDYADGEQVRDFLYVKDAVDMTVWFLDHRRANGIFNIGSGHTHTWNELARAVFKAMGKKETIIYAPMPKNIRDKYQYHTLADMRKIRVAGYRKRQTPFEAAVRDYVRHYLMKDTVLKA